MVFGWNTGAIIFEKNPIIKRPNGDCQLVTSMLDHRLKYRLEEISKLFWMPMDFHVIGDYEISMAGLCVEPAIG
ncbi:MAG: hypothetical protein SVG88_14115 [Halobacteriales archaeon]|nr:hypothetical protein [Halobacteriales archaeon]